MVEQYEASLIDLMTATAQFGRVDIVIDDGVAIGENKQNTPALASREHVHTHANTYTHIFLLYTYRFFFTRTSSSKSTRTLLSNTHTYIQHAHCLGSKHALCTRGSGTQLPTLIHSSYSLHLTKRTHSFV